jgi:hypothetical protein
MRPLIALALLSGATLFACSIAGDDPETQEADHTAGDPTFAQHEWLWANESLTEFEQQARVEAEQPDNWTGPARFLPVDHPMTQRLQFWVDRLDDAFRSRFPEKLKATPKPKILVRKSPEPNAWVSAIPVSWDVKTRVAGADDAGAPPSVDPSASSDAGIADADLDDASVPPAPAPPATSRELVLFQNGNVYSSFAPMTFERAHDGDKLSTFVKFHNDNFAKCRMEATAEGLVFSELCAPPSGLDKRRGERLSYYATATHVTFTTGYVMRLLVEDRIVSTLSHELGHYYRSHVNMPTDVVNYFYSLEGAHAHKPPPDPRAIEATAKAREKIRDGSWDFTEENALMKEKGFGFYTTEQEADEIALELLSMVGIPPGVAIDKILDNLKMADEWGGEGDPNAIKWAECAMLREQGWRDADGKLVSVPVGDPSNAHHNSCFRAFNMSREIAAHRYQVGQRPTPPGEEWSVLVTRLGNEVNPPPPPPPPPPATDAGAPSIADAGTD